MSRRIGVTTLSRVLAALARSESLVPNEVDRRIIGAAAKTVSCQDREPEVMVVGGGQIDPIVDEVMEITDRVDRLYDELHAIRDHVDDVLRLLRKERES